MCPGIVLRETIVDYQRENEKEYELHY
jgi:hypothetical protein